jgi:erythromycin esterase
MPLRAGLPPALRVITLITLGACAGRPPANSNLAQDPPQVERLDPDSFHLSDLGRAIGGRRIVLLGENGHGVSQFTSLKRGLVEYLHRELGFEMIAFESGFYECATVNDQLGNLTSTGAIRRCLSYAFEHAELHPLFDYIRATRGSSRPLLISGLDFQVQGNDSRSRPHLFRDGILSSDPALAQRLAALDSALLNRTAAGADSLALWLRSEGRAAKAAYDSAAALTSGSLHWALSGASALLDRLLVRSEAETDGGSTPARFYQARDDWMARTVAWLADSTAGKRKVIVWLHNDHARYGSWDSPGGPVVAAGALLAKAYPDEVYSIGFFMGRGEVANNSRQVRSMIAVPAGGLEQLLAGPAYPVAYTLLSSGAGDSSPWWGQMQLAYLRNGLAIDSMVPSREFDALIYVDSVTPPNYQLPSP